jgi:uncharacterized protein (DUF58 family)
LRSTLDGAVAVITAALREPRDRLLQWAERRLPALTRWRAAESLPIILNPKRIYVLPTRFGLIFGAMLVTMLLGALNFNNNAALLLTFLLAGAVVLSMGRGVRMIDGVRLVTLRAEPVHAGTPLTVELRFEHAGRSPKRQLELICGDEQQIFDLVPDGVILSIKVPTARRGPLSPGRLTLACEYPFGLFRAWSVLNPDAQLLVYPRPEAKAAPLPRGAGDSGAAKASPVGEEWHALREYRHGDPRRLIAWRASARAERLLVKEYAAPRQTRIDLAWSATDGLPHEQRIARLTRWVLDAGEAGLSFTLTLPTATLGPDSGAAHRHRCLRALALLP